MTPSQAAEGVVSEERLEHLAVMHFNIDFLPDRQEFIDIQIALRELQHLRRLSTQNTEGWVSVKDRLPEPFNRVPVLDIAEQLFFAYHDAGQWFGSNGGLQEIVLWYQLPNPPTPASRDVP